MRRWFDSTVSNGSFAQGLNRKLHRLFVLLTLTFVAVSSFRPMLDNVDIGWHVAQGRWMVEHFAIYRHDALNYPNLGHAVIDEYPLFQVVVYLAYALGWWGPCLFTAAAYVALFVIFFAAARKQGLGTSALFAASLGLLLLYLALAFPLRPHVATYLGLAAFGTFLLRHRGATGWREFWPLAVIQVAWTNCHSGFVLGPGMVALFGAEIIAREAYRLRAAPWTAIRAWSGAFLLVLAACFLNPFGLARFDPPFYQDQLESIRAYVGEMQPLTGDGAALYDKISIVSFLLMAVAVIKRRNMSVSFLILLLFFYHEALEAKKAWPVYGLFVPLIILSTAAFPATRPRKIPAWAGGIGLALLSVAMAAAVMSRFDGSSTSLQGLWREYDAGRSELSLEAVAWMKANGIEGRLFHRCEDGGWLQEEGYNHGETFADTGFGKYDEDFIHEAGLVGERPALLPRYLAAYQPDFVVCGDFCFEWPFYLKQAGWRLIFYSPNSSVWTRPGVRDDLPTVTDEQVMAAFRHDLETHGRPSDLRLFGRNLIALNSLGLGDFAFEQMSSLPKELRHAPWYWEAARIFCSRQPLLSDANRNALLAEVDELHDDGLTSGFRAWALEAHGDTDGALRVLEAIPPGQLGDATAELLLKIYLERKRPEALDLARQTGCWDLRNGRHWEYLALAEEGADQIVNAALAWRKAVFYYPDDPLLMQNAADFAARHHDAELQQQIEASGQVYSELSPLSAPNK